MFVWWPLRMEATYLSLLIFQGCCLEQGNSKEVHRNLCALVHLLLVGHLSLALIVFILTRVLATKSEGLFVGCKPQPHAQSKTSTHQ